MEKCESCENIIDEHGENGYCFDCLMGAFTPGNYG